MTILKEYKLNYQVKEERPMSSKKEFNAPKTTKVNSWGKH